MEKSARASLSMINTHRFDRHGLVWVWKGWHGEGEGATDLLAAKKI